MACHGNNDTHCCWISGEVCRYLEEYTVQGRRWACGLLRRAGSWAAVYQTHPYRTGVRPALRAAGITVDCGDWPQNDLIAGPAIGTDTTIGLCCYG